MRRTLARLLCSTGEDSTITTALTNSGACWLSARATMAPRLWPKATTCRTPRRRARAATSVAKASTEYTLGVGLWPCPGRSTETTRCVAEKYSN